MAEPEPRPRQSSASTGRLGRLAVLLALVLGLAFSVQVASATTRSFSGRVPRWGSRTFPTPYTGSGSVQVRFTTNRYDLKIKAVRCDNGTNLGAYVAVPANNHATRTIVGRLPGRTCFRLNLDAATKNYFDVSGVVIY